METQPQEACQRGRKAKGGPELQSSVGKYSSSFKSVQKTVNQIASKVEKHDFQREQCVPS